MKAIEMQAYAKINLSLDVIKRRQDGYHEVRMIMQSIGLHDTVTIEAAGNEIEVGCNSKWAPSGPDNIAYKAAKLILDTCKIANGIKINIDKRIPVAAGLAGGSADAAAVFKGINQLFSLELSDNELMAMGKQVGADVPYCINGGTMLAEGIGEILTPLKPLQKTFIVLVKPKIGVSTAWVYKNLDLDKITVRPDTGQLIKAIEENRIGTLAGNMANVLESVTLQKYEIIQEIKDKLLELGAMGSMMSGSGPTVFGIFKEHEEAEKALKAIESDRWYGFLTETVNGGI